MKRKVLFVFVVLMSLLCSSAFAYEVVDVVYLNDGKVIKGLITENTPGKTITIESDDGKTYVYSYGEISKIGREKTGPAKKSGGQETLADVPVKGWGIMINVLGLLQLGPQIEIERGITDNLYIIAEARWHAVGLLTSVMFPVTQLDSYAFGGGLRYFFRDEERPGAIYLAMHGQYGINHNADEGDGWEGRSTYIAGMLELGHRWRTKSGFCFNLSGAGGLAKALTDESWDLATPDDISYNDLKAFFIGMVVVSLGFEI